MSFKRELAWRLLRGGESLALQNRLMGSAFWGLFIAGILVVVTLGILKGFQNAYRSAVLDFNSHVIVTRTLGFDDSELKDPNTRFAKLKSISDFTHTPYAFYETLLPSRDGLLLVIVKGVKNPQVYYPLRFETLTQMNFPDGANKNRNSPPESSHGIADASQVYAGFGVVEKQVGAAKTGELKILKFNKNAGEWKSQFLRLKLSGTFESGLYQFDAGFVLTDLDWLQKNLTLDSRVAGFEFRLKNLGQLYEFQKELKNLLPDADVVRWDELNANLLEALRLEKTVVMVVTLLVMLMASLNLFGFVFLFLLSRRRDFQILGELGLSPGDHHQILAWVSAALGGVASLCSLVAGFFVLVFLKFGPGIPLNPDVYFVSRVPVEFDFWWLGSFWILNLFLAATAGFAVALHMGQRMKLRDQ